MAKAVRFHKTGGPEGLVYEDVSVGDPGPDEARVKNTAIGLNFIDTYHRSGLYPLPLPSGVGSEAAGVVEAVGKNVTWVKAGDRVAYAGGPPGAYSEVRLMPAGRLVKLPEGISDKTAAAAMLKGLTTQYLLRQTFKVQPGQTVLFHAAAGGVGLIAGQWLKALGVTAIVCWQAVVNIGMTTGILPVVGIPLPFFSYGGSSLTTMMVAMGLVNNVNMRRFSF